MKTTVLSVLGCVLIATGALQAQTTNVTLNVNIALSGVSQTGDTATKVRITTKDVIAALGDATSTSFSSKARLLLVATPGNGPTFMVRDGDTDTAISTDLIAVERLSTVRTEKTSSSGAITGTENAIDHIVMDTGTLSFNLQGYSSDTISNHGRGRNLLEDTTPVSYRSTVNGTGSGDSVLQGTITASGRKVEEIP